MNIELADLPPIAVRKNKRTRRLCLKLCARRGLRLIAPPRASLRHMQQFIEQHRAWIDHHWSAIAQQGIDAPAATWENGVYLPALSEHWSILRQKTEASSVRLTVQEPSKTLVLKGAVEDFLLVQRAIRTWLQSYAKLTLLPWLERLCQDSGLSYRKATARYAHTRWGSCSSQQAIMLNVKLLFLPKELVEYVMWHELCHTVHMNHSVAFWRLLLQFSPNSPVLRRQLRQSERDVPGWWLHC